FSRDWSSDVCSSDLDDDSRVNSNFGRESADAGLRTKGLEFVGVLRGDQEISREFVRFTLLFGIEAIQALDEDHLSPMEQEVASLVEEREPELIVRLVAKAQDQDGLSLSP